MVAVLVDGDKRVGRKRRRDVCEWRHSVLLILVSTSSALVVVVVELPMAELVCALQSLLHTDVLPVADDMDPIALDECVTFDLCAERLRLVFNVTSVRPPPPPPRP